MSKAIKCGIKISRFIDVINRITKIVNRTLNSSSFIYDLEKDNTLAEINSTMAEYMVLSRSKISVNFSGEEAIAHIVHSNINIFELKINGSLERSINEAPNHRILGASKNVFSLFINGGSSV